MEPEFTFRIEHPVLGRICGVVWDIAVTVLTTFLVPLACVTSAMTIAHMQPMLTVCTVPLLFVGIISFLVGFVWNFRRHLQG